MTEDAGAAPRELVIDLDELCWALNSRDQLGLGSHWFNVETGEVRFVTEDLALDEAAEDPRDDDRWLRVDPMPSSVAFRVMEDFVEQCADARLARALAQALQQRKPFRRFKDTLAAHPTQRAAWFAFERAAMAAIARRWCEDHDIAPKWLERPGAPST
jgi:hypothetical protein